MIGTGLIYCVWEQNNCTNHCISTLILLCIHHNSKLTYIWSFYSIQISARLGWTDDIDFDLNGDLTNNSYLNKYVFFRLSIANLPWIDHENFTVESYTYVLKLKLLLVTSHKRNAFFLWFLILIVVVFFSVPQWFLFIIVIGIDCSEARNTITIWIRSSKENRENPIDKRASRWNFTNWSGANKEW